MGPNKIRNTIIVSVVFIVFSLLSAFSGTAAWFISTIDFKSSISSFSVVCMPGVEVVSISMYKFVYPQIEEFVDYMSPEDGVVKKYAFNDEEEAFGETVDDVFHPVSCMNLYDPVKIAITDDELFDLNCNVIYAVTISSESLTTGKIKVFAERLLEKEKLAHDIFFSDCADFDLFLPQDLSSPLLYDDDPEAEIQKLYYPHEYKEQSSVLTENEEVYYKLSYLSSLSGSHAHFYVAEGEKPEEVPIHDPEDLETVEFVDGLATFYINVNYAVNQLVGYIEQLADNKIRAVFDYSLSVSVS